MLRLFLVLTIILLFIFLAWKLKRYLSEDSKKANSPAETEKTNRNDDEPQ